MNRSHDPPPVSDPPPDLTIAADTPCVRCGYNLRGLTPDMACPECFTPVAHTLQGNLLAYADPEWLARLRRGVALKLLNLLLGILLTVATVVALVLAGSQPGARAKTELLMLVIALPLALLGIWAVFLITAQEPRVSLDEDPVTLRTIVRACTVITQGGHLARAGLEALEKSGNVAEIALVCLWITASLAGIVAYFGEFVYLRRFAHRVPDLPLARSTTIVMWGMVTSVVIAGIGGALFALLAGLGKSAGPVGAVACVGAAASLVFTLWYVHLLLRYHSMFGNALAGAREMNEPPPAPPAEPATGTPFP